MERISLQIFSSHLGLQIASCNPVRPMHDWLFFCERVAKLENFMLENSIWSWITVTIESSNFIPFNLQIVRLLDFPTMLVNLQSVPSTFNLLSESEIPPELGWPELGGRWFHAVTMSMSTPRFPKNFVSMSHPWPWRGHGHRCPFGSCLCPPNSDSDYSLVYLDR